MAFGPVLQGQQLTLRPFASCYLSDTYVSWLRDPEITRFSEQRHRSHSMESCSAYVDSFKNSPNLLWAICDTRRNRHIGNIAATIDPNNKTADISILIGDRTTHGRGFGKEAWGLVLNYLSQTLAVRKVTGGCMAENIAMVRLMETSGMQPDGRRTNHYLLDGDPVDIIYYALFNTT